MSAVLGFVQGVAEFLPISSSGHLTLFQHFFGMPETDQLFNVLLHFATLLAVCVVYWRDIWEMIVEFFRFFGDLFSRRPRRGRPPEARRMVLLIIVGTLPLFLVLPIQDQVEALGSNPIFVSCALLVTGCILFLSDQMARGHKTAKNATLPDVLLVGLAQGVATIPGLSRSGCTISAGMLRGFDRTFAVRFSFLMSMPAVLGANILEFKDVLEGTAQTAPLPVLLVGMAVSLVVGLLAIWMVRVLVNNDRFRYFGYYTLVLGIATLGIGIFEQARGVTIFQMIHG